MKPIKGEKKIQSTYKDQLILTTHRVRYDARTAGQRKVVSIMLDELCSCELNYKSHIVFLLLAIISLGYGFGVGGDAQIPGIIGGVVMILAFAFTRKQILSLASAGGAIEVKVEGSNAKKIIDFIDAVELAKFSSGVPFLVGDIQEEPEEEDTISDGINIILDTDSRR